MQPEYVLNVQLRQLISSMRGLHWNEVSHFGQSLNNYPDGIVTFLSPWQSGYEIHAGFIPFPSRNWQRLQQSCWLLMLCLDSLTNITTSYEGCYVTFHSIPPIVGLQV